MVLCRPTRHLRTNTLKICHFHERGLEHITRKSTDTWKPGVTDKFGLGVQNEAGERLKSSAKRTH